MLPFRPQPAQHASTEEAQSGSATPRKNSDDESHDHSLHAVSEDVPDTTEVSMRLTIPATPDSNIPLAAYRTPSILPSEDVTSSGGLSFAQSSIDIFVRRSAGPSVWPELSPHPEYPQATGEVELELLSDHSPGPSATTTARQDPEDRLCFPWRHEFWWEDGVLQSTGGPVKSKHRPYSSPRSSQAGGTATGGSIGMLEPTRAPIVTTERSAISLPTAVFLEEEAYWDMRWRRGQLVKRFVDHFWRTHPPQRGNQQNQGNARQFNNCPRPGPYTRDTRDKPSTGGGSSRRLFNDEGNGNNSEGDDQDDDDLPPLSERPAGKRSKYLACPFQKWRPQHFEHCYNNHRYLSDVQRHVEKTHYISRCPTCHSVYRTPLTLQLHLFNSRCDGRPILDLTPGHITEQRLAAVRELSARSGTEQQWRAMFGILFPNEPQPPSIYVGRRAKELIQYIVRYAERHRPVVFPQLQAQLAHDIPSLYRSENAEALLLAAVQQFVPTLMLEIMAQDVPDWPPWAVPDSDSDTDPADTALSRPLPGWQNWGLGPMARGLESLAELDESSQPPEQPYIASSLHSNSQLAHQPIAPLPCIQAVELGYQPTATYPMDQAALLFPQLVGQDFTPQFYSVPNEDFLALAAHQNDGDTFQPHPGGGPGSNHTIPYDFSNTPEAMGLPRMQPHDAVEAGWRVPVPLGYDNVMLPTSHVHATSGCKTDDLIFLYLCQLDRTLGTAGG
ncbi:hypothetical protein B0T18DRAFT_385114 [Schizothecium vesticola]|uniref:Uncharacterized protein n=1 Tax=Schizothecium vesticola TaxID=314040 RepID=A0AA40F934_9PEZI|nr:hypothetical protein B0T18DRAFT_385114 [Schizothecium vesticola]